MHPLDKAKQSFPSDFFIATNSDYMPFGLQYLTASHVTASGGFTLYVTADDCGSIHPLALAGMLQILCGSYTLSCGDYANGDCTSFFLTPR